MKILAYVSAKTVAKGAMVTTPTAVPSVFAGIYGTQYSSLSHELGQINSELDISLMVNEQMAEETERAQKDSVKAYNESEKIKKQIEEEKVGYQKQLLELSEELGDRVDKSIGQLEKFRDANQKLRKDVNDVDRCIILFRTNKTSEWCEDHIKKIYTNKVDYHWV